MRLVIVMLGAAAAMTMAAAVSAAPAKGGVQLAQAQESGTQSGVGSATNQRDNTGNREHGGAATRTSKRGGKSTGAERGTVRNERTSHTSARGSEETRVSVRGGRTHAGVRTTEHDGDVVVKNKKVHRYVYSEPTTVIKKRKHYVSDREPSNAVVIKERREHPGGVTVSGWVSTRTNVHTRSTGSTTVGRSSTTRTSGGKGANVRSSGHGGSNSGGSSGGHTGQSRGSNRSGSSGGGYND
jgi:beta-xylosidase